MYRARRYKPEHHIVDPEGHLYSPSYKHTAIIVSESADTTKLAFSVTWPRIYNRWAYPVSDAEIQKAMADEVTQHWLSATPHVFVSKSGGDPNGPGASLTPVEVTEAKLVAAQKMLVDPDGLKTATVKQDHPKSVPAGGAGTIDGYIIRHWACPFEVVYGLTLKATQLGASRWLVVSFPGERPPVYLCDHHGGVDTSKSYPMTDEMAPAVKRLYSAPISKGV